MAGPWEKYQAPAQGPSDGPWAKYQSQNSGGGDSALGAAQAGIEHFGNAAAMGYLPQIQAAVQPNVDSAMDLATGNNVSGKPFLGKVLDVVELAHPTAAISKVIRQGFMPDKGYVEARDENIRRLEKEQRDYPLSSTAGTVAGSIAGGAAMSAAAPINAATTAGRVLQAAKGGAIVGALSNPGDVEGQVGGLQLDERKSNTVKGAALGAVAQGALEGVSKGVKSVAGVADKLQGKAEERAFKAAGAMLKDYRKAGSEGRVRELGRFMLDNDLVKPGMTVADVAEKSSAIRDEIGDAIGTAYDTAAASLKGKNVPLSNLDPKTLAEEFMNEYAASQKGIAGAGARVRSVQAVVDDLKELPADGGFKAVNKFRQTLDDLLFAHNKTPGTLPETKQGLAAFRSWLDQRVDGAVAAVDRATGGTVSQQLPELNRQYGIASELSKISKDQAFRQNANRWLSPSDYASGLGGAAIGAMSGDSLEDRAKKAAIGAGLGLVNKAARTYGTPLVSTGLDRVGSSLAKTPLASAGAAVTPLLEASKGGAGAMAATEGALSRPNLAPALKVAKSEGSGDRAPADQPRGESKWANDGLNVLQSAGNKISDAQAKSLLASPKGRRLLIEASDLRPGSKAMQNVYDQIQKELKKGSMK